MSDDWFKERDSRTRHYPGGRILERTQPIAIKAERDYVLTFEGQVAVLTITNLLARMCQVVRLEIPDVAVMLPGAPSEMMLADLVQVRMVKACPPGSFLRGEAEPGDQVFSLGKAGADRIIHSSGWRAYVGPAPSPLSPSASLNPFGAAFAAIAAVSEFCANDFRPGLERMLFDTLTWTKGAGGDAELEIPADLEIGNIWAVGVGSVGTAILYFLTLATRNFTVSLFDMDRVAIHNLDRSPIFIDDQVNNLKVDAVADFLTQAGVTHVYQESCAFHESKAYRDRQDGTPDLFISAANEFSVRDVIEGSYPPIQIYGTTGRNWQASLIRHVPFVDPCSCCLFPDHGHQQTVCAQGTVTVVDTGRQIDAALPFLSFAAGLMAAADIVKLALPGFPFSSNRVVFNTRTGCVIHAGQFHRSECPGCSARNRRAHVRMLGDSRYNCLSPSDNTESRP